MLDFNHAGTVVDVRGMPCALRHAAIFDLFDALAAGQSLVIVNDHDPAPLKTHFDRRVACGFDWTALEQGPDAWQVRVTRR